MELLEFVRTNALVLPKLAKFAIAHEGRFVVMLRMYWPKPTVPSILAGILNSREVNRATSWTITIATAQRLHSGRVRGCAAAGQSWMEKGRGQPATGTPGRRLVIFKARAVIGLAHGRMNLASRRGACCAM